MKASKIKLDYTINLGNYSNIKLGGEWDVNEGEDLIQCFKDARQQLAEVHKAFREENEKKEQEKQDKCRQAVIDAMAK